MVYEVSELLETIKMVESEHLDIRTVTMAISLRDTITDNIDRTCSKIYDKIMRRAENFVPTV